MSFPCLKYFNGYILPSEWKLSLLAWPTQCPPRFHPWLLSLACFSPFHTCILYSLFQLWEGVCSFLTPCHWCSCLCFLPHFSLLYLANFNSFFKIHLWCSLWGAFLTPDPTSLGGFAAPTMCFHCNCLPTLMDIPSFSNCLFNLTISLLGCELLKDRPTSCSSLYSQNFMPAWHIVDIQHICEWLNMW